MFLLTIAKIILITKVGLNSKEKSASFLHTTGYGCAQCADVNRCIRPREAQRVGDICICVDTLKKEEV